MELYKGRPEDVNGREEREIRVYDLLDKLGIEYLRTDHEHADTMEACNEIDAVLDVLICKNLFLCNRQKTNNKPNKYHYYEQYPLHGVCRNKVSLPCRRNL